MICIWNEVYDILSEALEFDKLCSTDLWDEEDLLERINKKNFLTFYTIENKKVICAKGTKARGYFLDIIKKGHERWKKNQEFYASLRK